MLQEGEEMKQIKPKLLNEIKKSFDKLVNLGLTVNVPLNINTHMEQIHEIGKLILDKFIETYSIDISIRLTDKDLEEIKNE